MRFIPSFWTVLSRRERLIFFVAAGLAAASALALGAIFYMTHTVEAPALGGTYQEGMVGQPAFVNPVAARSPVDKSLSILLFASVADLADHIETAGDGRTVKVHLKEGLRWSDGEEISSDDVIFTVESIQNPDAASPLAPAWQGVAARRISKLEIDFVLPGAYAFFGQNLENLRPVPKHLWSQIPPANWRLSDYNLRPVGSGPYVFASRAMSKDGFVSTYHLKANSHFDGGKTFLDTIDFVFERNRGDLLKAFNSGRVDGLFFTDPSSLGDIRRPYQGVRFTTPTYYAVFWNQSANPALAVDDVRAALALAVDRNALTKSILDDAGAPSTDPFSPAFLPPLDWRASSTDPGGMLDDAGWPLGEDGVRVKKTAKSSVPLSFTVLVPDVPFLVRAAEELRSDWLRIGAKVTFITMPIDELLAGPLKNRTYDAVIFGNTPTKDGDTFSFWHSSQRLSPGLNLALYQNKSADGLIQSIREEEDGAKRLDLMDQLRKIIAAGNPALFLFSPTAVYAVSKDLRGISAGMVADPSERFAEATSWYLTTKRVWK